MAFVVHLEPCALVPNGGTLQMPPGVTSVAALGAELGRQLRLAELRFLVWDEDFEEWCGAATLDEVPDHAKVRIKATGRAAAVAAPRSPTWHAACTGPCTRASLRRCARRSARDLFDSRRCLRPS